MLAPCAGTGAGCDGSFVNNKNTKAAAANAAMYCTTRTAVFSAAMTSEARETRLVEEPQRARHPNADERREHEAARERQRPLRHPIRSNREHLERERAVENTPEHRVPEPTR